MTDDADQGCGLFIGLCVVLVFGMINGLAGVGVALVVLAVLWGLSKAFDWVLH